MGRKKKDWSSEKERLESLYETLGSLAAVARQYGYESGVPSGVLAKRYNIDQTTLLRALRLSGAQMKEVGRPKDGSK